MEHPGPALTQDSSQPIGQAKDPPDKTTGKALQTTLPTAYRGVGLLVDWGGMRMQKQKLREDKKGSVTCKIGC